MLDNETFFTDAYTPKEIVYDEKFLKKKAIKKRLMYVLKILNAIVLIGIGLLFVYPFVWMFAMSLRSYEDVINDDLKKNLLNKLKPFYDLNQINIEFNIKWKLDVDVDYIF